MATAAAEAAAVGVQLVCEHEGWVVDEEEQGKGLMGWSRCSIAGERSSAVAVAVAVGHFGAAEELG